MSSGENSVDDGRRTSIVNHLLSRAKMTFRGLKIQFESLNELGTVSHIMQSNFLMKFYFN